MNPDSHAISIVTRERTLVRINDFVVADNHITFLFGESGIGKSLIAKTLYGILDPQDLAVTVDGSPYAVHCDDRRTRSIQKNSFFVFQEPSSHLHPLLRLSYQLREGSLADAKNEPEVLGELWEGTSQAELNAILEVYPKPFRPSGGEKQRILCAMAFLKMDLYLQKTAHHPPTLFVFDEPTGSLDNHFRDVFLEMLFNRFRQKPSTILLITHDYSMISTILRLGQGIMDRVAMKELGRKGDGLTLTDFSAETYTRWLHSQHPVSPDSRPRREILGLEGVLDVFGSRLTLSRKSNGGEASPLTLRQGSMGYIKAPSGTGKTTLIKIIMGLVRGKHLRLSLDGWELTEHTPTHVWQRLIWGRKMALVFQHADEALNMNATVAETFLGLPSRTAADPARLKRSLLELLQEGADPLFMKRKVGTLSGGQKQKLNLLRSLVLDTDVLILDEPLSGLDFASIEKVITLLQQKQREGKTLLIVSHNEEIFDALVREEETYYLRREALSGPDASS